MPYFTFQCIVEINEKKYCSLLILFFFLRKIYAILIEEQW